jgi:replicative DNA helicase
MEDKIIISNEEKLKAIKEASNYNKEYSNNPKSKISKKGFTNGNSIEDLPKDLEAEKAILGNILISSGHSSETLDEIAEKLKPEFFYDFNHQKVFKSVLKLWLKQIPIDTVNLLNNLNKEDSENDIDQDYLLNLISKSSLIADPLETVKLLKEKYTLRTIIGVGQDLKNLGFRAEKEPTEILDQAQKKLYEISIGNIEKNFVKLGDILTNSFDKLELLHQNKDSYRGLATGFIDLDEKLGGLQNSDLVILACRPSMGKTALSLEMAKRVAMKDTGVAYFSLEMSSDQLCERLISSTSNVDFHKIRSGNLSSDEKNREFEKIAGAMGTLADLPLWIDDKGGVNVIEIRSKARRLKMRHNIGLIVIDYLQLMSGNNEKSYQSNRVQEVSDISRNLKLLAKDLNIPIIALSQLSRKVEEREGKKPIMSDLRESGSIEQDADIILMLHRADYYNRDLPEDKKGKAEVIIVKNRNGETGMVELAWKHHLATFDNLYDARKTLRIEK